MSDRLIVADIVGVYGIKGWVKIRPRVEDPQTLRKLEKLVMAPGPKGNPRTPEQVVQIDTIRQQGKGHVAHFKGVDDRNIAEELPGRVLLVDADQLPTAGENEFYWRDLVGLEAWCQEPDSDAEAVLIGRVDHLLETGANDVLVIKPTEASIDDQERLVPYLPEEVVLEVDLENGQIWLDWYLDA